VVFSHRWFRHHSWKLRKMKEMSFGWAIAFNACECR
jgi:hypothetical protein